MATGAPDSRGVFLQHKLTLSVALGGALASLAVGLAAYAILNVVSPVAGSTREMGLAAVVALVVGAPLSLAFGIALSRARRLRAQIQRIAQNDGLTACLNETTFSALVDSYSNRAAVSDPTRGTILLINVDDLATVNDRFGYSWGNEALTRVAAAIKKTIRGGDIVGRVSGTQFGVFLPGADEANAKRVADRIYENVSKLEFFPTGTQFPLSIRAGAVIVSDRVGFDDLLHKAKDALASTEGTRQDWIQYESLASWQPGTPSSKLQ
jgi:diguanylate cyclase (GGDEF)-like protein